VSNDKKKIKEAQKIEKDKVTSTEVEEKCECGGCDTGECICKECEIDEDTLEVEDLEGEEEWDIDEDAEPEEEDETDGLW
jgi:hypothetical protein